VGGIGQRDVRLTPLQDCLLSATIANEFTEALGDLYVSSLIELGLILFVITTLVLAVAQLMLRRLDKMAGGAG